MKMVKSLLLGSAAGLVAVAGAQAADLPVKAKPVEYVKICSLYGVGFYYIPGTDMCLKVGGWVRAQYQYHANGSTTSGNFNGGGADVRNNTTNESTWRSRGYVTLDARNQTPYGTVRAYMDVGLISNDIGDGRAGLLPIPTVASSSGPASPSVWRRRSSSSLAVRRRLISPTTRRTRPRAAAGWLRPIPHSSATASRARSPPKLVATTKSSVMPPASTPVAPVHCGRLARVRATAASMPPTVVANLRVDQAWGSAQIMGALHEVNATYYAPNTSRRERPSGREVGLGNRRRPQAECADDRPRRLLPGRSRLHRRCVEYYTSRRRS